MREGRLTAEYGHAGGHRGEDHGRGHRPAAGAGHHERRRRPSAGEPPGAAAPASQLAAARPSGCSGSGSPASSSCWCVFVAVTTAIQPRFLGRQEIGFVLANTTVFALLALGETMVVISQERGPVDRLGAWPVRLPVGQAVRPATQASRYRWSSWPASASAWPAAWPTGSWSSLGRVPSLVVTLATLYIIRGIDILIVGGNEVDRADRCRTPSSSIPKANVLGVPYLAIAIAAVIGDGSVLPALVPVGPGTVRDRVQPGGGPAGRASGSAGGCSPRSRSAGRSPGVAGRALGRAVPDHRLHRGDRLRAAGDRRGRGRRGGDLRWQRQRRWVRRIGALLLQHDQLGAVRARHLAVLGPGDRGLPAACGHRAGQGRSRCGWPAALRTEEFRCIGNLTGAGPRLAMWQLAHASGDALGERPGGGGRRHSHLRGQRPRRSS